MTRKPDAADGAPPDGADDPTTVHVKRAESGDPVSLEWVVRRFSPPLLAQAAYRIGSRLRRAVDPEDLVSEVWAVALPRLRELGAREGRRTPVLLRFLSTTLLNRVNDLVKTELKGPRGRREALEPGDSSAGDAPVAVAGDACGVVAMVLARERDAAFADALAELDPVDREIILLRGVEQNAGATVARILGVTEKAVSMRYRRALGRLRTRLPGSVFADIEDG